jgi:hypothetical protein
MGEVMLHGHDSGVSAGAPLKTRSARTRTLACRSNATWTPASDRKLGTFGLSRVNSAVVGGFVQGNYPYPLLTYHLAAAEPDQPLVPQLDRQALRATLSKPHGNAMLLATTDLVHLYGTLAARVGTSIVTVTGGAANVVPGDVPHEECPPPVLSGEGGAGGHGGVPTTGGAPTTDGSSGHGGVAEGGAATEPAAGAASALIAGSGGDSEATAGRDSGGGAPGAPDAEGGGKTAAGESGNVPGSAAQPASGRPDDSAAGRGEGGVEDGPLPGPRANRESRGCGCRTVRRTPAPYHLPVLGALVALSYLRRRQRQAPRATTTAI